MPHKDINLTIPQQAPNPLQILSNKPTNFQHRSSPKRPNNSRTIPRQQLTSLRQVSDLRNLFFQFLETFFDGLAIWAGRGALQCPDLALEFALEGVADLVVVVWVGFWDGAVARHGVSEHFAK